MTEEGFKKRTKTFALDILRFVNDLPRNRSTDVISKQLIRSATSVGANYRAACRGRSQAEMVAKLGIVEEEADQCFYWIELLIESNSCDPVLAETLSEEASELLAMIVASIKTLKSKLSVRETLEIYPSIQNPKSEIQNYHV